MTSGGIKKAALRAPGVAVEIPLFSSGLELRTWRADGGGIHGEVVGGGDREKTRAGGTAWSGEDTSSAIMSSSSSVGDSIGTGAALTVGAFDGDVPLGATRPMRTRGLADIGLR